MNAGLGLGTTVSVGAAPQGPEQSPETHRRRQACAKQTHTASASRHTLSTPYSIVELSRLYDPTRPLSTETPQLQGGDHGAVVMHRAQWVESELVYCLVQPLEAAVPGARAGSMRGATFPNRRPAGFNGYRLP